MDQGFDLDRKKQAAEWLSTPSRPIQIYPRYFTPERHHMQTLWDCVRAHTRVSLDA